MSTLTQAGLCEGYGGLTMAVRAVLGARLAWYAEHEPATPQNPRPTQAAARLLAHHHPDLPNLGDLTIADWEAAPRVDILTGGWPCQPWSLAGQRKGAEDDRAIWPYVADAIRALRPRLVFLENVASIAAAGELARAAGDLAALGYVGSWRCLRASDVGAPHRRERIFIVAHAAADAPNLGYEGGRDTRGRGPGPAHSRDVASDSYGCRLGTDVVDDGSREPHAHRGREAPANADGGPVREQPVTLTRSSRAAVAGRAREASPDPVRDRREGHAQRDSGQIEPGQRAPQRDDADGRVLDWAGYAPAIHRWERALGRRAPAPTVLGRTGNPKLSPLFVEWLMGLPEGHVTAVPGLTQNQQLKLLGNGVVPQQAEAALRLLTGLAAGAAA